MPTRPSAGRGVGQVTAIDAVTARRIGSSEVGTCDPHVGWWSCRSRFRAQERDEFPPCRTNRLKSATANRVAKGFVEMGQFEMRHGRSLIRRTECVVRSAPGELLGGAAAADEFDRAPMT